MYNFVGDAFMELWDVYEADGNRSVLLPLSSLILRFFRGGVVQSPVSRFFIW